MLNPQILLAYVSCMHDRLVSLLYAQPLPELPCLLVMHAHGLIQLCTAICGQSYVVAIMHTGALENRSDKRAGPIEATWA